MLALQGFTYGLVIWLVLWALGAKAFDAFMIPVAMAVAGFAWELYGPYLKRQIGKE
jgi:hypothetical protein